MSQRRRNNRRVGIRRDNFVKLSLDDQEHALIASAARQRGMTISGFAAHAALGVARENLQTSPDARDNLIALNEGVIVLSRLSIHLQTLLDTEPGSEVTHELLERVTAAVETLEDAGAAVLEHSRQ